MKRGKVRICRDSGLDPRLPLSNSELLELMADLREVYGLEWASLSIRLVDDAEMARLNETFLGCKGPTNVLAFPAAEQHETEAPEAAGTENQGNAEEVETGIGEIALSVPTLLREAELYGQPKGEHFLRLMAHALLHLAGHDHGPLMDALTEQAVEKLRQRWG